MGKRYMILLSFVFLLASVSAWSNTTFNNTLTDENITLFDQLLNDSSWYGSDGGSAYTSTVGIWEACLNLTVGGETPSRLMIEDTVKTTGFGEVIPFHTVRIKNSSGDVVEEINDTDKDNIVYTSGEYVGKYTFCVLDLNETSTENTGLTYTRNASTHTSVECWDDGGFVCNDGVNQHHLIRPKRLAPSGQFRYLAVPDTVGFLTGAYMNLSGYKMITDLIGENQWEDGTDNSGGYICWTPAGVNPLVGSGVLKTFYNQRVDKLGFLMRVFGSGNATFNFTIRDENFALVTTEEFGEISGVGGEAIREVDFSEEPLLNGDYWIMAEVTQINSCPNTANSVQVKFAQTEPPTFFNPYDECYDSINVSNPAQGEEWGTPISCGGNTYAYNITFVNTPYPDNVSVSIDDYDIYNFTGGDFNQENNRTSNFYATINSYLSSCTIENGFCLVPIVFGADAYGILGYLDMLFENEGFVENSQTYTASTLERSLETFEINMSFDSSVYTVSTATLTYNNTEYSGSTTDTGNTRVYSTSINVDEVNADANLTFFWTFGLTDGTTEYYNSSFNNQTVQNVSIDDCSSYSNLIYNFTVRDEESRDILVGGTDNVTTEVDLRISAYGTTNEFLTYSNTFSYTNPATICLNLNLSDTDYRVDMETGYSALDYVQEFYFVDNGTLSNTTSPHIDLHDLLATDSTTFLFTFIGTDGLEVEDAIVHTHRKYIGDGIFREVERSRNDDNGDTHVHLVEEDVIYYFTITLYDQLIYTSTEYQAKCISTPCEIEIRATGESSYDDTLWDRWDGGAYTIAKNDSARTVTMSFTTAPSQSYLMDFTVYEYDNSGNDTILVVTDSLTASSGTIELTVPASQGNGTFVYVLEADDELIVWGFFSLLEQGIDYFGGVLGVILSALVVLTLVLMAVTEGVAVIVFLILGLILVSVLKLLDINWIALMSLIMAGAILIWKLTNRRSR